MLYLLWIILYYILHNFLWLMVSSLLSFAFLFIT